MSALGQSRRRAMVLDTMCLGQFARLDRLDVLGHLLLDWECWTTSVVVEELRLGAQQHPELNRVVQVDWLSTASFETDEETTRLLNWMDRVSSGNRDAGEASVFAAAELRGGVALTDDRRATQVGREFGVEVHGTIWLLARACRDAKLTEINAGSLIDGFLSLGARLPCTGAGFPVYARRFRLL